MEKPSIPACPVPENAKQKRVILNASDYISPEAIDLLNKEGFMRGYLYSAEKILAKLEFIDADKSPLSSECSNFAKIIRENRASGIFLCYAF